MGCRNRISRCWGAQSGLLPGLRVPAVEPACRGGQNPGMRVIWDGGGGRRVFGAPLARISADSPGEVPAALAAMEMALGAGRHVAGWLGYELGYVLEPRLARLAGNTGPLLRLGVFDAPGSLAPE